MTEETKEIKPVEVHNTAILTPEKTKGESDKKKSEENILNGLGSVQESPKPNTPPAIEKPPKREVGRPTVFTKEVLQKLDEAFEYDMTDEEACLHAHISPRALYDYQKDNQEFLQRKQALKNNPVMLARKALVESLKLRKIKTLDKNGNVVEIDVTVDPNLALKYLERKAKKEFSPQMGIEHSGNVNTGSKEVAILLQKILSEDDKPKETGSNTPPSK